MKLVQLTSSPPAFRGVCNAEQLEVWTLNKWRFIDVIVCMWCLVVDHFLRDVLILLGEIGIILISRIKMENRLTSGHWPCAGTGHWATRRQLFCPQELTARLQERKAGLGTGREEQETAIFVKKPLTVLWPVELYACDLCWSWTKPGPIPLVCAWFMIAFLGGQCPASYSLCPAP